VGNQSALIFGAVGYPDWSFLAPLRAAAAVFCADGGVNHVQAAGFSPDYYIGDGDSGGVPPAGIPAVQLPVHKDLTDLQAAWEQAFSLGFRKILLTGCTGGRQDHFLAAVQLLEVISARGCTGAILDPDNEITWLPPGEYRLTPDAFRFFSLLPADSRAVVSIRGAEYEAARSILRRGDSLGVSNAFLDGPARVQIHEGPCYLVRSGRIR